MSKAKATATPARRPGAGRDPVPLPSDQRSLDSRVRGNDDKSETQFRNLVEPINDTCVPLQATSKVYVGLEHIDSGAFWLVHHGHPNDVTSAKNRFQRNDILYGKLRPYLDKAVVAECDGICSTDILVFRAKSGVNPVFVLGLIHSAAFQTHAMATTKGVNHPRTSWNGLASFECFAPSPPEQEKIAAVLWKLQRAIATQDKLLKATADLKASAMQRLFTHGLRNEPLKDTEIGPMPESWKLPTLDEIATARAGHPFPHKYQGTARGDYPFYKVSDMNARGNEVALHVSANWIDKSTLTMLKGKTFPARTTVFPKVGGALLTNKKRLLSRDSVVDNNVMGVMVKSEKMCSSHFLFAWFQSIDLAALANPGPLPSLNAGRLYELKVPLPSSDEQHAIAAALAAIDRKLAHHRAKRAALHDLFQTLLHQLMTAQVRVAALDIDTSDVTDHFVEADKMVGRQSKPSAARLNNQSCQPEP